MPAVGVVASVATSGDMVAGIALNPVWPSHSRSLRRSEGSLTVEALAAVAADTQRSPYVVNPCGPGVARSG